MAQASAGKWRGICMAEKSFSYITLAGWKPHDVRDTILALGE